MKASKGCEEDKCRHLLANWSKPSADALRSSITESLKRSKEERGGKEAREKEEVKKKNSKRNKEYEQLFKH